MPFVHRQTGEQVGIAHDGAERRLKVVGNGKHHLLARGQQVLGTAAGFFQFAAIAVAARNVAPYDYQEKDGKQHRTDGNAADCLNGVMAYGLLVLRLFAGTLQGFLFVAFQQTVDTGGQHPVHALQGTPAALYNRNVLLLLLCHGTQLFLQGIHRIIHVNHRIRGIFEGSLYLNGGIFLRRHKHLSQTAEESFLPGLGNHRVAMRNDALLYALVCHKRILPGSDNIFYLPGRDHAVVRLAQHAQHVNGVRILLPKKRNETVRPLHVPVIGKHKMLHLPVHKEQGKEQHSQQQSVSDSYLYFRYAIHKQVIKELWSDRVTKHRPVHHLVLVL